MQKWATSFKLKRKKKNFVSYLQLKNERHYFYSHLQGPADRKDISSKQQKLGGGGNDQCHLSSHKSCSNWIFMLLPSSPQWLTVNICSTALLRAKGLLSRSNVRWIHGACSCGVSVSWKCFILYHHQYY